MTNIDICLFSQPSSALQPAHISPNRSFYYSYILAKEGKKKKNHPSLQLSILVYFEAQVYIFSTLTF